MKKTLPIPSTLLLAVGLVAAGCGQPGGDDGGRTSPTLVHLAGHPAAIVEGVSARTPEAIAWTFPDDQENWRGVSGADVPHLATLTVEPSDVGVRVAIGRPPQPNFPMYIAGIVTDVEGLDFDDWETVLVKARSSDRFAGMTVAFNLDEEGSLPPGMHFYASPDRAPPIFNDGSTQTYAIPLLPREGSDPPSSLRSIGVFVGAPNAAELEILEITLVPRGSGFPDATGIRSVTADDETRTTLYAHAPVKISYPIAIESGDFLDFGLTVNRGESVTYRVLAEIEGQATELFTSAVDESAAWQQHSLDLSLAAGADQLILQAESDQENAIALWGAPVLRRGRLPVSRPNVIFYVIDGGDADLMSLYGYERPTTPFLEELAKESVVFSRAYANSTWTQPSTVSFMTSLHHSVLGGLSRGVHSTAVPPQATTMAEHFRNGGYQTASFLANPNAGRMVGTNKGVDLMRDGETENHSTSSVILHEEFWAYREQYPGGPTWAHFQTTDVHEPNHPEPPFQGRFVSEEEVNKLGEWTSAIWRTSFADFGQTSIVAFYEKAIAQANVPRAGYFGARKGLYDETMLHQDHTLETLVAELKARGEWENTILVIGSDHGHPAGTFARFGRGLMDPQPAQWQGALFDAYATRIPLVFIWPGQIQGGRIVDTPVSMIDVLPTLLDLVGLPQPAVLQGQSLAPLLRGEEMEVRPVILDEFRVDEETGELIGNLEIIDGKWGASLEIAPTPPGGDTTRGRHAVPAGGRWGAVHPYFPEVPRLLLYDLEADPFATAAVNDEQPELVTHYERLLRQQWRAHQSLATQFQSGEDAVLSPDQLEQLRALGYIQ